MSRTPFYKNQNPSLRIGSHAAKNLGPELIYMIAREAGIMRRDLTGGQYEAIGESILGALYERASVRDKVVSALSDVVDEARADAESYLRIGPHTFRVANPLRDTDGLDRRHIQQTKQLMDRYVRQREAIEEDEHEQGAYVRMVNALRQVLPGDSIKITYNDPQRGGLTTTVRTVEKSWDDLRDINPGGFSRPRVQLAPKVQGKLKSGMVADYGKGNLIVWQPTMLAQVVEVVDLRRV